MRHPLRVADGVLRRQQATPRVPEQHPRFEPEPGSNPIEIVDLGGHRDMVGLCAREGSAAATLVVVHDAEGGTQPVNLRHEVLVVEVRTTVHYDDRQPITEIADKRAHTIERHEALASDRSRRTWTHGLILPAPAAAESFNRAPIGLALTPPR